MLMLSMRSKSIVIIMGIIYIFISYVLFLSEWRVLFCNLRFMVFFALVLVAFCRDIGYPQIVKTLALGIALEIFFTMADYNRISIVYDSLDNINIEYNIDPIIFKNISSEPTRSIIEEPAFYGNLLAQWMPPKNKNLTISFFFLTPPLLLFIYSILRLNVNSKADVKGNLG